MLIFHALHTCTLHQYIKHFIMDILDQDYERFVMILRDLKFGIQVIALKQVIEAIKSHDT